MASGIGLRQRLIKGSSGEFRIQSPSVTRLKQVIRENGKKALRYEFIVHGMTYNSAEYAIVVGDPASLQSLFDRGAKMEASSCGTLMHFYVIQLSTTPDPHPKIFSLLLKYMPETVRLTDQGGYTALERAVQRLELDREEHWDVITTLLQTRADISKSTIPPWAILVGKQKDRLKKGMPVHEKERSLECLSRYLILERRFCTYLRSTFSLEEFRACVPQLSELQAVKDGNEVNYGALADRLTRYHQWFCTLVGKGSFKDCFNADQLALLTIDAKKTSCQSGDALLKLFKEWTFIPEDTDPPEALLEKTEDALVNFSEVSAADLPSFAQHTLNCHNLYL